MHGRRTRKRTKPRKPNRVGVTAQGYRSRRITRRQAKNRRILAAILAAAAAVEFQTSFFLRTEKEIDWTEYEVKTGDTLWSICRERYGEGDIRHEIDLISTENGITGGRIYPGSVIRIIEN